MTQNLFQHLKRSIEDTMNKWVAYYSFNMLPGTKAYEPVREKTNNLGSDQVRHKPGCTVTEYG